jgi:hypothetical protein
LDAQAIAEAAAAATTQNQKLAQEWIDLSEADALNKGEQLPDAQVAAATMESGCSNASSASLSTQTINVSVIGTNGALSHSAEVQLTIE